MMGNDLKTKWEVFADWVGEFIFWIGIAFLIFFWLTGGKEID